MRRLSTAALLPLVLTAAVACGGSDPESDTAAAEEGAPVPVTFGSLSVAQAAPFVLAEQQGIFEDNGIDLTIEFVEAAAMVPGLLSGEYDLGYLNAPAVLAARGNGVPVKSVMTTSNNSGDAADFPIQIVVPTDSPVEGPEDLAGLRIATDTLFQLPDLGARGALLDAGVDPSELEIIEINFPDMGTAMEQGRVDAAIMSEPFGTILRNSGAVRDVLSTARSSEELLPQSVVVASEQFIGENEQTIAAFQQAVDEALQYALDHDDEVRAVLPEFTPLEPELAEQIRLAPMSSEDSPEGWQAWADLLVEVGVLEDAGDASEAYLGSEG